MNIPVHDHTYDHTKDLARAISLLTGSSYARTLDGLRSSDTRLLDALTLADHDVAQVVAAFDDRSAMTTPQRQHAWRLFSGQLGLHILSDIVGRQLSTRYVADGSWGVLDADGDQPLAAQLLQLVDLLIDRGQAPTPPAQRTTYTVGDTSRLSELASQIDQAQHALATEVISQLVTDARAAIGDADDALLSVDFDPWHSDDTDWEATISDPGADIRVVVSGTVGGTSQEIELHPHDGAEQRWPVAFSDWISGGRSFDLPLVLLEDVYG